MKLRLFLTAAIALVAIGVLLRFGFESPEQIPANLKVGQMAHSDRLPASTPNVAKSKASEIAAFEVDQILRVEAPRVGAVDDNPKATTERLREIRHRLKKSELQRLATVALDTNRSGDERFLSAYLLSVDPSTESVDELMDVSLAAFPTGLGRDRLYDQELVIRMKALEGLAAVGSKVEARERLNYYISRQNNVYLAQYAKRLQDE